MDGWAEGTSILYHRLRTQVTLRLTVFLDAVESSLFHLETGFLGVFWMLRLICPGLFRAVLWHQCTRLGASAILNYALIFPLWRLQVPPSDAFWIDFSLGQCICEPPVCTHELMSFSDIVVGLSKATVAALWVCEPGWSFSSPLMALLHPQDGEDPGGHMPVWKGGDMDEHCEAKARCVVQPIAFPASWYLKACEQQLETSG